MKLATCIIHNCDKNRVTDRLVQEGFKFTIIASTGGFLREGNTTMLIGVEEEQVAPLKTIMREECQTREQLVNSMPYETALPGAYLSDPVKVPVGGAVMFLTEVAEFDRF